MSYLLIKRDTKVFEKNTSVNLETLINNCYLVSDLKDNLKREWIMYYDLYKLIDKDESNRIWYYEENYDKIMKELISKL